jgi:alcohol dehydrogenase class IV
LARIIVRLPAIRLAFARSGRLPRRAHLVPSGTLQRKGRVDGVPFERCYRDLPPGKGHGLIGAHQQGGGECARTKTYGGGRMEQFTYYQPTRIIFGNGRRKEAGAVVSETAKKVLFVVGPNLKKAAPALVNDVRRSLAEAAITVIEYDNVIANPTLASIQQGAELARAEAVEACVGMGGGSAIDTAKAIAVAATHPGTAWDYLYFKQKPTSKTLPIFAIPTTAGTGTQTSKVSVFTNTAESCKSAMWNDALLCRAAIIDPELTVSLPRHATASTGFDVFTHTFESYINVNAIEFVDRLALDAIARVIAFLPKAVADGGNLEARANLAWADTLAGMCLANVGTTLPHAAGQPISGHYPHVSHGESLAVIYPAFADFTWQGSVAKFARVARMFNKDLAAADDRTAASGFRREIERFLDSIGMRCYLEDFGIRETDLDPVLKHAMEFPDHQANPVRPTEADMRRIYLDRFRA